MVTMFLEMVLYGLGAAVLIYLIYTLFFAASATDSGDSSKTRTGRRFERREGESGDRRKRDIGPPPGVPERRKGSRRSSD